MWPYWGSKILQLNILYKLYGRGHSNSPPHPLPLCILCSLPSQWLNTYFYKTYLTPLLFIISGTAYRPQKTSTPNSEVCYFLFFCRNCSNDVYTGYCSSKSDIIQIVVTSLTITGLTLHRLSSPGVGQMVAENPEMWPATAEGHYTDLNSLLGLPITIQNLESVMDWTLIAWRKKGKRAKWIIIMITLKKTTSLLDLFYYFLLLLFQSDLMLCLLQSKPFTLDE